MTPAGVLLVDKPEGTSSAGVIRALASRLGEAKVGHLGTLDPFASGLLPLCVGQATKVARYLLLEEKAYTGTIRLGVETDTLDRTGAIVASAPVPPVDADALERVAGGLRGRQEQVPPMYSALKRDGVPLYKLARRGVSVPREPRQVVIHELTLRLDAPDRVSLALRCSKGTYVRVLASDVARSLGTVGHLAELRRTRVGTFRVEDAWTVERFRDAALADWPLLSIRRALPEQRAFEMPAPALARLRQGQQRVLRDLPGGSPGEVAVLTAAGGEDVAALVEMDAREGWRLVRLLHGSPLQG